MISVSHFRRVACGLLGLLGVLLARGDDADKRIVLQLPYTHQFQFAGVYAAVEQGYFQEEGLDVEIRPTSEEHHAPIDEVTAGRAHFGIAQGPQLIASRLEGKDVVVVAAIMQHSPQVLVTRAADNLNTPHDLVGKRVAMDRTSLQSEIRQVLEREGVGFDRITVVPDRWADNELLNGTADAMSVFVIDMPYAMARAGLPVRIIRPADYGVDFYGDCLFTSERVLAAAPQRAAGMRRAILRGWAYALQRPEELIEVILARYPAAVNLQQRSAMDREALRHEAGQMALLISADLIELGRINPGRWKHMAEVIHGYDRKGDPARIEPMLYQPPLGATDRLRQFAHWLIWALAVALLVAIVSVLTNRRLQSLVKTRTEELQQSEQRQREYFDLAPAPIVIEDYTAFAPILARYRADGITDLRSFLRADPVLSAELYRQKRVVAANRLALARTDSAADEPAGRKLVEVMTDQALDVFVEELGALWDEVDRLTLEKSYRTKSGEGGHTLINWEVGRKDGQRDLANVRLVFTDVTQQKRTEQALRESEARYRRLFEQAPIAVVEFDYSGLRPWFEELRAKGVTDLAAYLEKNPAEKNTALALTPLADANETTLKLLGAQSKAELVARLGDIVTESTIAVRCANAVRIWNGVLAAAGQFDVKRLDGQRRTLSYHWRMEDENGKPSFRRTQTVLADVTEQLAAERALRESEARYRELFEQAAGGIFRSSPDGRFLAINPGLARIFGFARPEEMHAWVEQNSPETLYVKPGRRQEFVAAINAQGQVSDFESEVRHRGDGTSWVSENARAVRDSQGHVLYYEGFVTDITARRHLESEMARASKLEAVGLLAGGIAHDFNNILTVVLGNVTLAEADTDAGAAISARLADARRATLRARDLTLQLLTFAKGGEPVKTTVDLPELLKESAGFALHGAKARAEFRIATGLWPVHADKGQLGQVVQNLVINASQAMPGGGVVTITAENHEIAASGGTGALPPGRYVHLSVADTGVGISPDNLAKIFDPYFTTKAQGTGLGLATTYSIIKKHEGHILAESEAGKGTVFRLWLPAGRSSSAAGGPAGSGSRSPFRVRVLFMDDEATIRGMAEMFMQRLGYDCDVAADGAEAIRKYQDALAAGRKYEVVLMDLTVPGGMGGREAMEHLRRLDPSVCAIVSSGYSRDPVMSNHREHGFQGILPKPYGLEQLRKVMRDVIEGSINPT
ncbi:MAG TPA: ABC transporter substrate-binding protein [Lacunisphaera sp.]|nr:ABC transporter substrate-binding protein [Lacunisphaera sp.]